jgi:hypothetical protein
MNFLSLIQVSPIIQMKSNVLNLKTLNIQPLMKYLSLYFYWQVMQQTKAQRNKTKEEKKRKEREGKNRPGQVARMCGPICSKFEWCEKLHIYIVSFIKSSKLNRFRY